jgi:hypothetical protein
MFLEGHISTDLPFYLNSVSGRAFVEVKTFIFYKKVQIFPLFGENKGKYYALLSSFMVKILL